MYYRYKSRKKDRTRVKVLAVLLIAAAAVFFGLRYREYLQFWKYSENKLAAGLQQAVSSENPEQRAAELADLLKSASGNIAENPADQGAWFFRGKVYFESAWLKMPGTFSEIVIKDLPASAPAEARDLFIRAVKDIKKGKALSEGRLSSEMQMMLAQACFFSGFTAAGQADELLAGLDPDDFKQNVSSARFYSFIQIISGRAADGFACLDRYGDVASGMEGRLFLAGIRADAGLYTDAVMVYRDLLTKGPEASVQKLIHLRLGKIFAVQSLYPEALREYSAVLELDPACEEAVQRTAEIGSAAGQKNAAESFLKKAAVSEQKKNEPAEKPL